MSGNPTIQPPSYDEVLKASAPPVGPDEFYGAGQPPYPPMNQQPPFPMPQQPPYPASQPSYPPQPVGYNYGSGVAQPYPPHQQYPPVSGQPLHPGYGAPPMQVQAFSQPGPVNAQGQYTYNTVTVVGPNTNPGFVQGYGPVVTNQYLTQQMQRKRICIAVFVVILFIIFFIVLVGMLI